MRIAELFFGPLPPDPKWRLSPAELRSITDRSDLRAYVAAIVRFSDDIAHDLMMLVRWHEAWVERTQRIQRLNTGLMWVCVGFGVLRAVPALVIGDWTFPGALALMVAVLWLLRTDISRQARQQQQYATNFRLLRELYRLEIELSCKAMDLYPEGIPDQELEALHETFIAMRATASGLPGPASTPT